MATTIPTPLRRGGLRAALAKYAAVFQVRLASSLAYVLESLFRTLFLALVLFIFLQLWHATYAGAGAARIAGLSLPQMLWYLALTEAITLSRAQFNLVIDEEVKTGALAYTLSRPYHYLLYHYADHLGERLFRFGINLVVGSVLALAAVGPIPLQAGGLLAAALAVLLALTLDFAGVLCVSLLAFWIEDTRSAALLFNRLTMILGGLLMPIDIFPAPLARLCRALPFGSVFYTPARLFVAGAGHQTWGMLGRQVLWIIVFAALAVCLYHKGVRRVESNGG